MLIQINVKERNENIFTKDLNTNVQVKSVKLKTENNPNVLPMRGNKLCYIHILCVHAKSL